MIRPSNWPSRWLLSLCTVAIGTLKLAAVAVLPTMVRCPVTDVVRPTAVAFCPNRTSLTRKPTTEPVPALQVPATEPPPELVPGHVLPGEEDADAAPLAGDSDSAVGVLPL